MEILKSVDLYDKVMANVLYLTTDSRDITRAVIDGSADIGLNWKAASIGKENSEYIDSLPLDDMTVFAEEIRLSLLEYSLFPEIAQLFIDYAVSDNGQEIFRAYGF